MTGTINVIVSLMLITLFSIAVIGFASNWGEDNNAAVSIIDDVQISNLYNNAQDNATEFRGDSQSTYSSIVNSSIEAGSQTTPTGGQFAITTEGAVKTTFAIFLLTYINIFGGNPQFAIFVTVAGGLILFIIALYFWKTWRSGQPD